MGTLLQLPQTAVRPKEQQLTKLFGKGYNDMK